ncbi:MAG: PilZ domain-containing protein [Planctomycetota bacterium]
MADRRQSPRVQVPGLRTELGEVMDLSLDGAAVYCKGRLRVVVGQTLPLRFWQDGVLVAIDAQVVRIEPVGLFRHEVALRFPAMSPGERGQLRSMLEAAQLAPVGAQCYLAG